jgi:hypothetical protein
MRHAALSARTAGASLFFAGMLALAPRAARADEAQEHLDRGIALGKQERYVAALAELDASYALRPSVRVLYLRALAHQRMGDATAAIEGYERVLAAGSEVDPAIANDARERLAKLRSLVGPVEPPAAVPHGGAAVNFVARNTDDTYRVATSQGECVTPCRMFLPSGRREVRVSGSQDFRLELHVPHDGGTVMLRRGWNGLLKTGVTLMTLGSAMMIAGNAAYITQSLNDAGGSGVSAGVVTSIAFGWAIGPIAHLTGIILMAAGLGTLADTNRVGPALSDTGSAAPLRFEGIGFAPVAHGTTARLTFSF